MLTYTPNKIKQPSRIISVPSAWRGLESILEDILDTFDVKRVTALEFGVEYGYSTAAMANFFQHVTGVDTFEGDGHSGRHESILESTKNNLRDFNNITLVKEDFKDYIGKDSNQYDLIHIDIEHFFQPTYDCGSWAVHHAPIVLFHDTVSFIDVFKAVTKVADENRMKFYNFAGYHGLGILIRQ